ncbi:hypothetical protein EPUS_02692 [Endocarpon pusillum Z07020]|uniref:Uncharacterized protein n=1 Tax=Endocarpon pusillum (strain Z07020 / HMAS-L-300199) TaxID=1263415 RepID=U1G980_ENDPU|nr:uncharacterized protein EPUS_02692 [Endocarpon pusillum Z07020]ERF68236.1 hypothetical protein EPUS_02692 [Endocarpon pusillum Z07020]
MSLRPLRGPSKGLNKPKPRSLSKDLRVLTLAVTQVEAKSSSSSEDDGQATRAHQSLSTPPTENGGPSGVLAVDAGPSRTPVDDLQSSADFLSDPFNGLIIDQSLTSVEQLPDWAHPVPRWDAVRRRTVSRRPPSNRSSTATSQPSSKVSDNMLWIMYPPRPRSLTHQGPILRRITIPEHLSGSTPIERNKRIRHVEQLADRVREIRLGGRAPQATRTTGLLEIKLVAWASQADNVNALMPELASTTVWVNPFRLLNDVFYDAWVKLFMQIYVLGDPR